MFGDSCKFRHASQDHAEANALKNIRAEQQQHQHHMHETLNKFEMAFSRIEENLQQFRNEYSQQRDEQLKSDEKWDQ